MRCSYPEIIAPAQRGAEVEARLLQLLARVQLLGLFERFESEEGESGAWEAARAWEDTLSLGEQQHAWMGKARGAPCTLTFRIQTARAVCDTVDRVF